MLAVRCVQELRPGLYSLAFSAAAMAARAGTACAARPGESLQRRLPIGDGLEQGGQQSIGLQQSPSPAEAADTGSWCVGTVVEHPWRDSLIARLRADHTSLPPSPTVTFAAGNGDGSASSQLPDGFDAAVAALLEALGEAVRVRCNCIDRQRVGQVDGPAHAKLPAEPTGVVATRLMRA